MPSRRDRPLGLTDIAELFGVEDDTAYRWRYRQPRHGVPFPDPDGLLSHRHPYWWETSIERWGRATGRWPGDAVAAERLDREEQRLAAAREAERAETTAVALRAKLGALEAELRAAETAAAQARERAGV